MLGGESFMVPGNTDSYLTRAYGKNYRNKSMENYVPGSLVVCSTLIPCEEFLQQSKELKKFASVRKKREKRRQFGMNYREYLAQCWDYAKFCGENIPVHWLIAKSSAISGISSKMKIMWNWKKHLQDIPG